MTTDCRFATQIALAVVSLLMAVISPFVLAFWLWQGEVKHDISTLKAEMRSIHQMQSDFRREYREDIVELWRVLRGQQPR